MSRLSDERAIAQAIAGEGLGFSHFQTGAGNELRCQGIVGPFAALTPFCLFQIHKSADEYQIEYDCGLLLWPNETRDLAGFLEQMDAGPVLWKHNVYPATFTLMTFTEKKLPHAWLVFRVRDYLTEHSQTVTDACAFLRDGDTDFLNARRRLNRSDYDSFLEACEAAYGLKAN